MIVVFLILYFSCFSLLHFSAYYGTYLDNNTRVGDVCRNVSEFSDDFRFIFYLLNIPFLLFTAFYYDVKNLSSAPHLEKSFNLFSWEKEWIMHYRFLRSVMNEVKGFNKIFSLFFYFSCLLPFRLIICNDIFFKFSRTWVCLFSCFLFLVVCFLLLGQIKLRVFFLFFFICQYIGGICSEFVSLSFFYSSSSYVKAWLKRQVINEEFEAFFFAGVFSPELNSFAKWYFLRGLLFDQYFIAILVGLHNEDNAYVTKVDRETRDEVIFRVDKGLPIPEDGGAFLDFLKEAYQTHSISTARKLIEFINQIF